MITEDYVSYEVARLLKEKGFDENTEHKIWYVIKQFSTGCHWNSCTYKVGDTTSEYNDDCCISMPTLQMAMKWLREAHKVFISIIYENDGVFVANLKAPLKGVDCMVDNGHNCWLTYGRAAEEAIKYCLENLIK